MKKTIATTPAPCALKIIDGRFDMSRLDYKHGAIGVDLCKNCGRIHIAITDAGYNVLEVIASNEKARQIINMLEQKIAEANKGRKQL